MAVVDSGEFAVGISRPFQLNRFQERCLGEVGVDRTGTHATDLALRSERGESVTAHVVRVVVSMQDSIQSGVLR